MKNCLLILALLVLVACADQGPKDLKLVKLEARTMSEDVDATFSTTTNLDNFARKNYKYGALSIIYFCDDADHLIDAVDLERNPYELKDGLFYYTIKINLSRAKPYSNLVAYNFLKNPEDICFFAKSQDFMGARHYKTNTVRISKEAIESALKKYFP